MRCKQAQGFLKELCSAGPFSTHASEIKTMVCMCVSAQWEECGPAGCRHCLDGPSLGHVPHSAET